MTDPLHAFLAAWLFFVGGSVGSFINVVVLRVPARASISKRGSHCPKCGHSIRGYDNVPMLSWLVLGGRCRDCRVRISPRYPIVEALVAAVFLWLGIVELLSGGANLPMPQGTSQLTFLLTNSELAVTYAGHVVLISTLICASIMAWDGNRVPWQLFLPAAVAVLAMAMAAPGSHPVHFRFVESPTWQTGMVDSVLGLLIGVALAGVAVARQRRLRGGAVAIVAGLGLVGMTLGWQAGLLVGAVTSLVATAGALLGSWIDSRRKTPWLAYMTVTALVVLLYWRDLDLAIPWAVSKPSVEFMVIAGVIPIVAGLLGRFAVPHAAVSQRGDVIVSEHQAEDNLAAIVNSPSYRLAAQDRQFLARDELRPVRLELELMKPELAFQEQDVQTTIVVFGGTRIVDADMAATRVERARQQLETDPDNQTWQRQLDRAQRIAAKSSFYEAAREFGRLVSSACQVDGQCDYVIVTGGGPGIMEAANRGAFDVDAKSIGLNITLPDEQFPNPYITPELCFQFHYFAIRKMHFLLRAKALIVFPGGFGTLDELFDALTLRQTKRMQQIPIILFGREYWSQVINFQFLADEGVISDEHLDLIEFADTPIEAWEIIQRFHAS